MSNLPYRDDQSFPFRLWNPDEQTSDEGPTLKWTLRDFYEQWFAAHRDAKAREATKKLRFDLLRWWEQLTDDPPLWMIDDAMVDRFTIALAQATYTRSPLPHAKRYPVSIPTQRKLLTNLRTLVNAIGPKRSRKCKTVHLVAEPPLVDLPAKPDDDDPKEAFSLKQVRAIAQACGQLEWPTPTQRVPLPPRFSCGTYWYALLCVWYYTGFRYATVLGLRWSMIEFRKGSFWLRVPSSSVTKTGKGRRKFLHPEAVAAIEAIRTSDPQIFPCPYGKKWHDKRHLELQRLAGIAEEDRLSPHAWRRTHAHVVEHVGRRKLGEKLAQLALDHADAKTTRESYLRNEHKILRRLPRLIPKRKPGGGDRQLPLF